MFPHRFGFRGTAGALVKSWTFDFSSLQIFCSSSNFPWSFKDMGKSLGIQGASQKCPLNHHESAAQTFSRLGQKLLCKWFHSIPKIFNIILYSSKYNRNDNFNMWFLSFLVPTKQCKITASETTCQSLGDAQVINEMASKLYRVFLQWVIGTPKIGVKLVWKTIFPLEIAYFQLACAGCFGCKPTKQHQNNKIKAPKSWPNRNSRVARNETHLQRADLLLGKQEIDSVGWGEYI